MCIAYPRCTELCWWPQVLPMAGSAGGCERNWSTYDFITNRKRNKLEPTRAEDLVYVHYNRRCVLKSRQFEQFPSGWTRMCSCL